MPGGMFWTPEPTPGINGPFENEADLNEALVLKKVCCCTGVSISIQGRVLPLHPIKCVFGAMNQNLHMGTNDGMMIGVPGWFVR